MRIRLIIVATVVAIAGIFPFASPASATHNCGFEPCPHPEDIHYVTERFCEKYSILKEFALICP